MIYLYVIVGMCSSFLLAAALLLFYLRYKKNLLHQQFIVQKAEIAHQRKLTQVIITSQEQERKRIGKELHDDVGNALASLRLYLDKQLAVENTDLLAVKKEYNTRIATIYQKLRSLSHQLSVAEIERFGLRDALYMLSEQIEQTGAFSVSIDESGIRIPNHLEYDTSVIIYRVFQELLTNTIKHSGGDRIAISFHADAENAGYRMRYTDNGRGFIPDPQQSGLGFKNMESRLQVIEGYYKIPPTETTGFTIDIFIPAPLQNA